MSVIKKNWYKLPVYSMTIAIDVFGYSEAYLSATERVMMGYLKSF